MMASICLLLSAGSCLKQEEIEALFCDVEEMRKFSQEEIDWRAANAPWNLRKDFKTNTTFERECLKLSG